MCFNRPNKIALTIISQLTITKANIIENFGKENNKITSQNVRVLKRIFFLKIKKDHFWLCVLFTSMVFLLLP